MYQLIILYVKLLTSVHEGDFGQQPTERLLPPVTAEAGDDVILTPEEWQALEEAAGQILLKEEEDELMTPCSEVLIDIALRYLGELEDAEDGEAVAIRVMSRLVNLLQQA